jgi:hypothetical protein
LNGPQHSLAAPAWVETCFLFILYR